MSISTSGLFHFSALFRPGFAFSLSILPAGMAVLSKLLITALGWSSVALALPSLVPDHHKLANPSCFYPGWAGIKHMFMLSVSFESGLSILLILSLSGDSYTTTGFNDTLAQPSAVNPLGNPAYP